MSRCIQGGNSVVFCLLCLTLTAAAAFGEAKVEAPVAYGRYGPGGDARGLTHLKNRLALEAYEKRNAGITLWPEDVVPTITNNAALLYYQACLVRA